MATLFESLYDECYCCGKPLNHWRSVKLAVNYDNAYSMPLPLDVVPVHGEYGLRSVGPSCARKLPKRYILYLKEGD